VPPLMTAVAAGWRSAWARMESTHEMEAGLGRVAAGWKFVCCINGGEGKPGEVELYTCGREGSSPADV
jgi:hypothetical protein